MRFTCRSEALAKAALEGRVRTLFSALLPVPVLPVRALQVQALLPVHWLAARPAADPWGRDRATS